MRISTGVLTLFLSVFGFTCTAFGQGTITDGPVSLTNGFGVPFSTTGANADLTGVIAGDPLFHIGWGYRQTSNLGSNTLMGNFGVQGEMYVNNVSTISFLDNGSGPAGVARFDAVFTTSVRQTATGASFRTTVTVTNVNPVPLVLDLFQVVDWDLGPAPGGDTAVLASMYRGVTLDQEEAGEIASLYSETAIAFQPGGSATLRSLYSSGNADLNNAEVFTGDAALALQWTLELAPGESQEIRSRAVFGNTATPCAADQNFDGFVNNADVNLFVGRFLQMDPLADVNADGVFNNTDINQFVVLFLDVCGGF